MWRRSWPPVEGAEGMLRVHVGVCGIGMGHAARSSTLIRAMERLGWRVSVSSYGDGLDYLRNVGLSPLPSPEVGYGVLPEGKVSIKLTIFRNTLLPIRVAEQTLTEMSYMEDADVVVSDTRGSTVLAAKLLGKPVITILNQFNVRVSYPRYRRLVELAEGLAQTVSWMWAKSDQILIADFPPPLTISSRNISIPKGLTEKIRFIGPIIEDTGGSSAPEKQEDGRPLVFIPLSGPRYERRVLAERMLRVLPALSERFRVVMTLGGLEMDVPGLPDGVRVLRWVDDQMRLFQAADVVVCRSGQTTLAKALVNGKPVAMIPIPAHAEQEGNALSVQENGAGIMVREEEVGERLPKAVEKLVEDESYRRAALRYREAFLRLDPVSEALKAVAEAAGKSLSLEKPRTEVEGGR